MAHAAELPPEVQQPIILREDYPKLRELKTLGAAVDVWKIEFDFEWVDFPEQERSDDEPYYPMQMVFTDRESGRQREKYRPTRGFNPWWDGFCSL